MSQRYAHHGHVTVVVQWLSVQRGNPKLGYYADVFNETIHVLWHMLHILSFCIDMYDMLVFVCDIYITFVGWCHP